MGEPHSCIVPLLPPWKKHVWSKHSYSGKLANKYPPTEENKTEGGEEHETSRHCWAAPTLGPPGCKSLKRGNHPLLNKLLVFSVVVAEGGKHSKPCVGENEKLWGTRKSVVYKCWGCPEPKWFSHYPSVPSRGWPTCFPQIPPRCSSRYSPRILDHHWPEYSLPTSTIFSRHLSRTQPFMEFFYCVYCYKHWKKKKKHGKGKRNGKQKIPQSFKKCFSKIRSLIIMKYVKVGAY